MQLKLAWFSHFCKICPGFHLFFSFEITNKNNFERKAVAEDWWHVIWDSPSLPFIGIWRTCLLTQLGFYRVMLSSVLHFFQKRIIKDFFKYLAKIQIVSVRVLPYPGPKEIKDVIKSFQKAPNLVLLVL